MGSLFRDWRTHAVFHLLYGGIDMLSRFRTAAQQRKTVRDMNTGAVDILIAGAENRAICFRKGEFTDIDLAEALSMKKDIDTELWDISRKLCR